MSRLQDVPGVYCIRNKVTGKRYVGSSASSMVGRVSWHKEKLDKQCHGNRYLQHAWNKYGPDAFSYSTLEKCSPECCIEREQYWMDKFRVTDRELGYNICPKAGSSLGVKRTAETREKVAAANRGKVLSEEHREAISKGGTGQKRTEETKQNISIGRRTFFANGGEHPWTGKHHSKETKAKISAANKGQNLGGTLPSETCQKLSVSIKAAYDNGTHRKTQIVQRDGLGRILRTA